MRVGLTAKLSEATEVMMASSLNELGFIGSLYGTLMHYGHGPAPVFLGADT